MSYKRFLLASALMASITACSAESGSSDNGIFSDEDICKSAVGAMFNKEPSIIKSKKEEGLYKISYVRSSDNTSWDYKCKIGNGKVEWGSYDGRWRNHKLDSIVKYSVNGDILTIKDQYNDGSATVSKYKKDGESLAVIK